MLTSRSDAYISKSGDFCGDDDDRQTKSIASLLAHARGVISEVNVYDIVLKSGP